MKIISWNVNGIRAVLKKEFEAQMTEIDADVICVQETKAHPEQVPDFLPSYHKVWSSAQKKGYSGTAIFSKQKPIASYSGLTDFDTEGRVTVAEFEAFFVVSIYTPNSKPDLSRLEYREKQWDPTFLKYMKELEAKKPVIFCGDINVAHNPIDLKNDKANEGEHGYTLEERKGFSNLIEAGFVDTFRQLHPDKEKYSWWSYFGGARGRNVGWRIDYIMVSQSIFSKVQKADILNDYMGSDHCPVLIELE